MVDAGRRQAQVGLEQLELEADAARLAPQQELGVGEGQPVGIGLQRLAAVGMGLQRGPGVAERRGLPDVFGGFHDCYSIGSDWRNIHAG